MYLRGRNIALPATLLALAVLSGVVGLNFGLWTSGPVMPAAAVVSAILGTYALNMAWGYLVETSSKRKFAALFGQ